MPDNVVTTKSAIAALTESRSLLAEHAAIIAQAVDAGDQQGEPPPIVFKRTFDFGLQTIDAIIRLLSDGEDYALHACTLCRTFYETAVRLLWAARTPDGWQKLQAYFAEEDRRWANAAKDIPSMAEYATPLVADRQEFLERTDETGKTFPPAPGMQQLLRDVVKHDIIEGIREKSDRTADWDYTNVYRILCRAAHGHITALWRPAGLLPHATNCTIMAVSLLLQARCHVSTREPEKEISAILQKLLEITKRHQGGVP